MFKNQNVKLGEVYDRNIEESEAPATLQISNQYQVQFYFFNLASKVNSSCKIDCICKLVNTFIGCNNWSNSGAYVCFSLDSYQKKKKT